MLNQADQKVYVDRLNEIQEGLGNDFRDGEREDFECTFTDIPTERLGEFMQVMIEWKICEVVHKTEVKAQPQ